MVRNENITRYGIEGDGTKWKKGVQEQIITVHFLGRAVLLLRRRYQIGFVTVRKQVCRGSETSCNNS